jgi:hypothetical protein
LLNVCYTPRSDHTNSFPKSDHAKLEADGDVEGRSGRVGGGRSLGARGPILELDGRGEGGAGGIRPWSFGVEGGAVGSGLPLPGSAVGGWDRAATEEQRRERRRNIVERGRGGERARTGGVQRARTGGGERFVFFFLSL